MSPPTGERPSPPRSPQPVQCDTARSTLLTQGSLEIDGLGVSAIVLQGRNFLRVGGAVAAGVAVEVFKVFSLDRVLQRLGGADHRSVTAEQIVDIPAPRGGRVLHPARRGSGGAVLRRDEAQGVLAQFSPGNFGIISTSSSSGRLFMRQLGGFRKNFPRFLREDELGS